MFVCLYFKHLKLVYERLHLNYEWESFTCHENDEVSVTTTGFLPGYPRHLSALCSMNFT